MRVGRRLVGAWALFIVLSLTLDGAPPGVASALAQRADDNAVTAAEDAFGTAVGREGIGIYGPGSVRGFSPSVAGNTRIEGLYADLQGALTGRVRYGLNIKVGAAAQSAPFPAPTGIVDLSLRRSQNEQVTSILGSAGPYGSTAVEIDALFPRPDDAFEFTFGAAFIDNNLATGGEGRSASIGMVPRWSPNRDLELTAFFGKIWNWDENPAPIYITQGNFLPPKIERGIYRGPRWAKTESGSQNAGLFGLFTPGAWTFRAGLFHSVGQSARSYAALITGLDREGRGERGVFVNPDTRFESVSGELRLSRRFDHGAWQHLLLGSLRGRKVDGRFGGSDFVPLGSIDIAAPPPLPDQPDFSFSPQRRTDIDQLAGGLSYGVRHGETGELRLSLQRNSQTQSASGADGFSDEARDDPWLPTVTGALQLSPSLSAYASFTRGLEATGTAPTFAANRLEVLPAAITEQLDGGISLDLPLSSELILGYFHIEKPYFALSADNRFEALGTQTHEGVEISLSSSPSERLAIVLGGVLMDPQVDTDAATAGTVGPRPVGQPETRLRLDVNYELPFAPAITLDAGLGHRSAAPADVANSVEIAPLTTVDLGMRYRFTGAGKPILLRGLVRNLTDENEWRLVGPGAYEPVTQRSIFVYLTADL